MALKTEGLRGTENDSYRLTHCSGALHRSALWKVPRFNMKESCLLIFSVGLKDRRLLGYSLETRLVNTISPLFFCGAKIGRRHPFFFFPFLSFFFFTQRVPPHAILSHVQCLTAASTYVRCPEFYVSWTTFYGCRCDAASESGVGG